MKRFKEKFSNLYYFFFHCKIEIREFLYRVKYAWQRARHGYADEDWYDIDRWFMRVLPRLLTDLRNKGDGYPAAYFGSITNREDWKKIIDEMLECLAHMDPNAEYTKLSTDESDLFNKYKEANQIAEKNKEKFFKLFSKYFYNLWD